MSKQTTSYINYAGLLEFLHLNHENTDLYLSHCGIQQCKSGHTFEYTKRPEYHLHFILDGQGSLFINNKKYNLSRGQIFVIPPNVLDYSYKADLKKPWYYAWVGFNGSKAAHYMKKAGFDYENCTRCANIPIEEFTGFIYDMLASPQLTLAKELERTAHLYKLLSKLIETKSSDNSRINYDYSNETYIKQALQFIGVNFNRAIHVKDIVEYVGINRSYFSRIFKQKLEVSPKVYLQNYRLKHACKLLCETNESVESVAKKVGYQDAFTFSKLFKKLVGMSPGNYRNSMKK